MKTNKNAFRISSIILSLIMIIVAIPTFGVMAEDTTEPPEYYFWDNVEYKDVTDPNYIKTGDTLKYNRTNGDAGAGFTLVNPDNKSTNYKLSANTTYRLSFKYKVTAITEGSRIKVFAARFSNARVQAGNIQFYNMLNGYTRTLNLATIVAGNKTTEVRLIDSVMTDFTNYTVVFTTPDDLNSSGFMYDDLAIIIQGKGSAEIDDVEIAEITDEVKTAENYVAVSDDFSDIAASGTANLVNSSNVYMSDGVAKDGSETGYAKNTRVAKLNNVSGNNGFYFTSDYAVEAGATYTMRFKYFVPSITEGVTFHANPSLYFAKGKDTNIKSNALLFTGDKTYSNYQATTSEARGLGIKVTKANDKFEVCEITFTVPSSFFSDANRGVRQYLTISTMVVGDGSATVCFDDFEIAKVTGSTTYYPNLNGSDYVRTNADGVALNRSLVMTDAVVAVSELAGCADADMSNFKFTGWYSDVALENPAANDTANCYAAWDIAKDYTVTRDFAEAPFVYNDDKSKDIISHVSSGVAISDDNGKAKVEFSSGERYYLIRDNNYENFKLYPNSVYKIELNYELEQGSEFLLGLVARYYANLTDKPTTLLTTADSAYPLDNNSLPTGKLVYYFSTKNFSVWSNWQVGQYIDSLSLTIKGSGSISFSSISVTALATEQITNEFTFEGENVTWVIPNQPGIVTRFALTAPADGSSISVHTNNDWQVDALGLTVNNTVLYDTNDTAGKVYNTALVNGDKIAINGFHKGNCVNAANFAVVAAQTVDYPDTDEGVRFRIRSYNYNNADASTVAYNKKEYMVVSYGIKVGKSFVKDDIAKAAALKTEGTDISLAEANAYHSTDSFTDYTLAVKDVEKDKYIYALGYMILEDIETSEKVTVYSKNALVNSYNDLQSGTLGSMITIAQE